LNGNAFNVLLSLKLLDNTTLQNALNEKNKMDFEMERILIQKTNALAYNNNKIYIINSKKNCYY
jgi:hypothetical protein